MIHLVPVADVDKVWPALAEGMEKVCKRGMGSLTSWDILRSCRSGMSVLFVVWLDEEIKGGLVCEIHERPQGRTLKIVALCGQQFDRWLPELHAYDLSPFGITHIMFDGRKGWQRRIKGAHVITQTYEMSYG